MRSFESLLNRKRKMLKLNLLSELSVVNMIKKVLCLII